MNKKSLTLSHKGKRKHSISHKHHFDGAVAAPDGAIGAVASGATAGAAIGAAIGFAGGLSGIATGAAIGVIAGALLSEITIEETSPK